MAEIYSFWEVEKPYNRFVVFSDDGKLEWGNRLVKGHQVYVKLPGDNTTWSAGVVRHVGGVASLPYTREELWSGD